LLEQAGSTRASVVFFSNFGVAYTSRIAEIPACTGYGEPIQRFFMLKDGEKIVGAMSLDERAIGNLTAKKDRARRGGDERRLRAAVQPRAVRHAQHVFDGLARNASRSSRTRRGGERRST
jgi:DNA gyrase/topoisomerase IV subunit A